MAEEREQRGFTLTELVLVILIAGILSAVAYSKIDTDTFKREGTTDQAKAALRYAHKLAVAQRRNVYLTAASNTLSVCYDSGCGTPVPEPGGNAAFTVSASSGLVLSSDFYFGPLGRPTLTSDNSILASAVTLTFTGGRTITIEPQTGFVH